MALVNPEGADPNQSPQDPFNLSTIEFGVGAGNPTALADQIAAGEAEAKAEQDAYTKELETITTDYGSTNKPSDTSSTGNESSNVEDTPPTILPPVTVKATPTNPAPIYEADYTSSPQEDTPENTPVANNTRSNSPNTLPAFTVTTSALKKPTLSVPVTQIQLAPPTPVITPTISQVTAAPATNPTPSTNTTLSQAPSQPANKKTKIPRTKPLKTIKAKLPVLKRTNTPKNHTVVVTHKKGNIQNVSTGVTTNNTGSNSTHAKEIELGLGILVIIIIGVIIAKS